MGLERCVDCESERRVNGGRQEWRAWCHTSEMAGDVVSLRTANSAVLPLAGETKVVGAFPANVYVAKVVVEGFWIREGLRTLEPETNVFC